MANDTTSTGTTDIKGGAPVANLELIELLADELDALKGRVFQLERQCAALPKPPPPAVPRELSPRALRLRERKFGRAQKVEA